VERKVNQLRTDADNIGDVDSNGDRGGALEPTRRASAADRPVDRFTAALLRHREGRHVIVIRGYPDPDSLASAWAHARIAAGLGIDCDIAHLPVVSRAENRAMVNLLDLPLIRVSGPEDLDRYAALSLVDAHSIELPKRAGLPCVSIVDHHGVMAKIDAEFVDIRPAVGATSTIYTEYLLEGPVRILGGSGGSTRLSTALAYGIRSDTDDLLRATPYEFQAMAELAKYLDVDILASLSRYQIPTSAMRIIRRALEAMRVEGTWILAGVGQVRPQDRDAIGQAADFLVRREGTRTVVTFGLVDGWIDGSLRTTDPALDPASWLRDIFGIGPLGTPYGGGRRGKGGFQIPLGPIASCPDHEALWRVVKEMIENAILRRLGPSQEEEDFEDALVRGKNAHVERPPGRLPPRSAAR
jgi:nanoRNase/pAp phosphatase (c-di-AMP/oligoRNAs hydrolase)